MKCSLPTLKPGMRLYGFGMSTGADREHAHLQPALVIGAQVLS